MMKKSMETACHYAGLRERKSKDSLMEYVRGRLC